MLQTEVMIAKLVSDPFLSSLLPTWPSFFACHNFRQHMHVLLPLSLSKDEKGFLVSGDV
jgi:hypothetical protein